MKRPWVALAALVLIGLLFTAPWALAQNSGGAETTPNISAISGSFTGPVASATSMSSPLFDGGNFRGVNADFTGTLGVGGTATFGGLMNADTVDAGTLICHGDTTLDGTVSTGGMVTVGTNSVNQLILSGSAGTPAVSVDGPGADIGLSLQAKGVGAVRVESPYSLAVDGDAIFGGHIDVGTLDAGVQVITPKICYNPACSVNQAISGATIVSPGTIQAGTLTATNVVQPIGSLANGQNLSSCSGHPGAVCVNDVNGLAIADAGSTVTYIGADGTAIFSGRVSAPVFDGGTALLTSVQFNNITVGNPGCTPSRSAQVVTQPFSPTTLGPYFCESSGATTEVWRPMTPGIPIVAYAQSLGAGSTFLRTPPLEGVGLAVRSCQGTVITSGTGGAIQYIIQWKYADAGMAGTLCTIPTTCDATNTFGNRCALDGGARGPFSGGEGYIDFALDGGCASKPDVQMMCIVDIGIGALPL